MLSCIMGRSNAAPSNSAASYLAVMGTGSGSTSTESARYGIMPGAFTLKNFYVSVNNAPGGAAQYVFTIRKNGADTAITLTIAGAATSGTYTGAGVSAAAGDKITMSLTPTGTPAQPTVILWNLQADSGPSSHFAQIMGAGENTTSLSTSVTSYASLFGHANGAANWSAAETDMEIICPAAGTLSNLYVAAGTPPGTGKSYTLAVVQNGSASALTAAVSAAATTAHDTTHSVTVSPGDTLSVSAAPSGTPAAGIYSWGVMFTPANPGESFLGFGSNVAPSATATQYEQPMGPGTFAYNNTEANRQIALGATTLKAVYVSLGTAPGGATSRTATIRRNAVSTPLSVAMSGVTTSGSVTGKTAGVTQTDLIALQMAESGTPAADTGGVHLGVLLFTSTAAPAAGGAFFALMG